MRTPGRKRLRQFGRVRIALAFTSSAPVTPVPPRSAGLITKGAVGIGLRVISLTPATVGLALTLHVRLKDVF